VNEACGILRAAQGVEQCQAALEAEFEGLEFVTESVKESDGFGIRSAQDSS